MGILSGKRGLVVGITNKWSIGNQIAKECHDQGADVFVTWHSERSKDYVQLLAKELNLKHAMIDNGCFQLDITKPNINQIIKDGIRFDCFGGLDFIVHSVAKAPKECFKQPFSYTTIDQFNETMLTSVWSFINLVNNSEPILNNNGSIITISYIGSRRIVNGYNVMGPAKAALDASVRELANELGDIKKIRVNAISAGPIKTLSSAKLGIKNMSHILAPLKRKISLQDISNASIFLLSDLSNGITGTILDVDSGLNILAP